MSASPAGPRARPPGLYRAARAIRILGILAVVLTIVFVGLVLYSTVQLVRAAPQIGTTASTLEPNGTVGLTSSFEISNPGFLSIQSFGLDFRIANASGAVLAADSTPVTSIGGHSTAEIPIAIYVPVSSGDASLLTVSQNLSWHVWANATFGYLFPASIGVITNRSWGAPFAGLTFTVGAPMEVGGNLVVPVQVSFTNDASFADSGTIDFEVVSSAGTTCGSGSFVVDVPPNTPSDLPAQDVALASGCDPAGGHVSAQYVQGTSSIPLPSEPIP